MGACPGHYGIIYVFLSLHSTRICMTCHVCTCMQCYVLLLAKRLPSLLLRLQCFSMETWRRANPISESWTILRSRLKGKLAFKVGLVLYMYCVPFQEVVDLLHPLLLFLWQLFQSFLVQNEHHWLLGSQCFQLHTTRTAAVYTPGTNTFHTLMEGGKLEGVEGERGREGGRDWSQGTLI